MRVYTEASQRLNDATQCVTERFPRYGVNKTQEIARLIYELSKRDKISPRAILDAVSETAFHKLKARLVRARYPIASRDRHNAAPYLPPVKLDCNACFAPGEKRFSPRRIFVESAATGSAVLKRFARAFPEADITEIPTMKTYMHSRSPATPAAYNKRTDTVFVVSESHDFFKRCPCTKGAVPCGYHIFNMAFGCIYECTYCFLQGYANVPGILFPTNIESYFDRFDAYLSSPKTRAWGKARPFRIGTGEFSDSLMLDDVTGYSTALITFFKQYPHVHFELKTKSNRIRNLLQTPHGGNIVAAWSLNPQCIIDKNELYTAPLAERIAAARRCADAGYRLAFHFDPVIHFAGWEREYALVIERLFAHIQPEEIAWISIGTLRFAPPLKQIIEARFPANTMLDGELLPGFDGKLRYPRRLRLEIYARMIELLKRHCKKRVLYLCMEDKTMWNDTGLPFPFATHE
jgi:spore photoproduct lyase